VKYLVLIVIFLGACNHAFPDSNVNSDPCSVRISQSLRDQVLLKWPGSQLPRETDNLPSDITYNKENGGNGCLGMAEGDFDGDGRMDLAFLLGVPAKRHTLLIAALGEEAGWRFECLRSWETERSSLYVAVAPPGRYTRFLGFDEAIQEPGEVEAYRSESQGIISGVVESSGIYYFRTESGWVHVWVSD